jgi:predicted transposase YbfD/YdcC
MEGGERYFAVFEEIPDPRVERARLHELQDVLTMALFAVLCGCDTFVDIAEFAEANEDWFEEHLKLAHGVPSHDTFTRVFARMDPVAFEGAFQKWVRALGEGFGGNVAIDGKTLRRSFDAASGKGPLHLVGAFATESRVVLGQVATRAKSNEIKAIPELLALMELKGCTVTIDAIGCQQEIAARLVGQKADYVLGLKENQAGMLKDVREWFEEARRDGFKGVPTTTGVEKDHGRIETRTLWATEDLSTYLDTEKWEGLRSVAMLESVREVGEKRTMETRWFISSLPAEPERLLKAIRGHWAIENSLHWSLDVTFREDDSRVRKGHADQNLAVIRRIALNLLKKPRDKKSIRLRRKRCSWDLAYMLRLLAA